MKYEFVYTGIRVRDLEKALRFYTEALNMMEAQRVEDPDTGGVVVGLRSKESGQRLELNWYGPRSDEPPYRDPGEALDHLAFIVSDVDAAYAELISKGAKPLVAPHGGRRQRIAFVTDPDGTPIELAAKIELW